MKKYIQYNAAQYATSPVEVGSRSIPIEVGSRSNSVNSVELKDDCSGIVLDLSGKHGTVPVSMASSQKWGGEQDSALDLSSSKFHNMGRQNQAEALDLSKPSYSRVDTTSRAPFSTSSGIHQSAPRLSQTPPTSNLTRPPTTGQYSLLQAALNSTQSNTAALPSLPEALSLDSRARMIAALAALEGARGIKPFTSVGSRLFGMSIPPLSYPNPPVTVVQGIHKPIAITAPQPHVSNAESKSKTSCHTTISVSNSSKLNNEEKGGREVQCTPGSQLLSPTADKLLIQESYQRDVERYVLQSQKSLNHIVDNSKLVTLDTVEGFTCTQCSKSYKTKAALKLHATVHKTSDERQYECLMCKRRFLHRHHLVVHQRKHSGEKPFKCDACGKTFMAIFLLHKHLRKHVREVGQNCQIASEQLTQLTVKKDTMDVTGFNKISVTNTNQLSDNILAQNQLTMFDDNHVLSMNDAAKIAKLHEMNLALLDKRKSIDEDVKSKNSSIEVIDLSSDDLSNSKGSGIDKDFSLKTSISSVSSNHEGITLNSQEICQNVTVDSTKSECRSEKCEDSAQSSMVADTVVNQNIFDVNSASSKLDKKDLKDDEINDLIPFPTYTSEDEVELDCQTGELKILPKVPSTTVDNLVDSQTENQNSINNTDNTFDANLNKSQINGDTPHPHSDVVDDDKETRQVDLQKSNSLATHQTQQGTENDQSDPTASNKVSDGIDHSSESNPGFRQDRNIFDDVEENSVCKDINMNEQDGIMKADHEKDVKTVSTIKDAKGLDSEKSISIHDQSAIKETTTIHVAGSYNNKKKGKKNKRKGKRVKCEVCSRMFHSDHHLILHMAVHKKNQMLQSLKKAKAQQMKLMGYQQMKTNVVCQICMKGFKFQKSLNSHMRVHSEKLAKQKLLSKAFRDFMLEAVPSSRTTDRTLSSASTIDSASLLKTCDHAQDSETAALGVNDKVTNFESRADCIEYLAQYSKNDRLEDPPIKVIIGKDNIKRFLCHACDNTYTTKQKLRMHALIHKDNCFLCDICGKSFFRLLTLEKHIATHKLPRPHICVDCKKSFIHRSSLMRHRVIHEKPNQPSIKQQVEDINFELKMLDTYTMLRQERLQKLQDKKMGELNVDPVNSSQYLPTSVEKEEKVDILDLSVRIKPDDVSLPPVLSPANTPSSIQLNPLHLSPPVITDETCHSNLTEKQELANLDIKREPEDIVVKDENQLASEPIYKSTETRKKRNSDEMVGLNELNNDTFHKKSRKTRVYQTSCRVCKEKFPNVMTLKSHMSVHNMVETHLYECNVCHHRFTQSCSLLRHLKTSCQENRLKCLPCGKSFHQRYSYEQHMKLHNGLPPNLDGSFYDRRKDEVEGTQVKEERESDIENNNINNHIVAQNPVKLESVKTETLISEPMSFQMDSNVKHEHPISESVKMDFSVKAGPSGVNDTNYDSDDSDAKTFLYSEGEGRIKDLTDFDETVNITGQPDLTKSTPRPQSVDSASSSGVMTLNLLSAVCSDIRNAEKEEETRRKEMEERQKELETIEILANLKRGRMQNNTVSSTSNTEVQNSVHLDKTVSGTFDANNVLQSMVHNQVMSAELTKKSATIDKDRTVLSNKPVDLIAQQTFKSDEQRSILNIPQIPTVVFEIAKEAERLRQERLAKTGHTDVRNINTRAIKDTAKISEFNPQAQFLQGLSQMTLHDRLSLLMKAQIPPSSATSSVSSHVSSPGIYTNKPLTSLTTYTLTRPQSVPTVSSCQTMAKSNIKLPPQVMPQDLSMKKHSSSSPLSHPSSSMSPLMSSAISSGTRPSNSTETGQRAQPLVPVFHCELCGKMIYNQLEYQVHLQEHLHAIQMKGHSLLAHHGNTGQRSWVLDRAQSLGGPPITPNHQRGHVTKSTSHTETIAPPTTLDLTTKKSVHPIATTQEVSSPMTSSDFSSDTIPSPSTPSSSSAAAMNLDVLRKELRNKIYARRRSQGLEDLTVEFKSPEPTEMTEEERVKLDFRRECNRQAAQRSRMRKKDLVDSLIEELHEEEIVNCDLRQKLESLTAEKNYLLKALEKHTCVRDKTKNSPVEATNAAKQDRMKEDDQS